jgi:hypothetical protein
MLGLFLLIAVNHYSVVVVVLVVDLELGSSTEMACASCIDVNGISTEPRRQPQQQQEPNMASLTHHPDSRPDAISGKTSAGDHSRTGPRKSSFHVGHEKDEDDNLNHVADVANDLYGHDVLHSSFSFSLTVDSSTPKGEIEEHGLLSTLALKQPNQPTSKHPRLPEVKPDQSHPDEADDAEQVAQNQILQANRN